MSKLDRVKLHRFQALNGWNLWSEICTAIPQNNQFFHCENFAQVPLHNRTLGICFVTSLSFLQHFFLSKCHYWQRHQILANFVEFVFLWTSITWASVIVLDIPKTRLWDQGAWPKNVVTWPNLKIGLCKVCYPPGKFFLNKLNSYPKI